MHIINVVTIIVRHNDRILLLYRKKNPYAGWWALPGGKLELGESLKKAVIRELKEETGIQATNPRYLATVNEVYTVDGITHSQFVLHYFDVQFEEEPLLKPSEEGELKWFSSLPERMVPSDQMVCESNENLRAYDLVLNLNKTEDMLELLDVTRIDHL